MSLPQLPRILKKREADITPKVIEWFKKNYGKSVALEIKIKGGKLKPHQELALKEVASGTFAYKIPDTGRRNPFDAIVLHDADSYVVVCDQNGKCIATGAGKGVQKMRLMFHI